jgi:hemerythrin superfamily protein
MTQAMDALTLLKRDHDLVKDLMGKIEKEEKDGDARTSMFEQLVDELGIHERIEEELFYPALKRHKDAREDVLEGFEEHHLVDEIIEGIDDVEPGDERWPAKFKVLKENVEHHIEDEETTLFPKAEKLLGDEELGALGVKMADMKEAEQQALAEQLDEEEEEESGTKR